MLPKLFRSNRRKIRVKNKISLSKSQYRISIFKSNLHLYCQLIDSTKNNTLTSISTLSKDIKKENKSNCNKLLAKKLGEILGKTAKEKGIKKAVLDRGPYKYHGIIKTFAESVRKSIKI